MKAAERFFWQVVDELDYWLTPLRLRVVDALCGPEPETPADGQRIRDRERLEKALQGSHERPIEKEIPAQPIV